MFRFMFSVVLMFQAVELHGDEPLSIETHYLNPLLRSGYKELRYQNVEQYGLDDRLAHSMKDRIEELDSFVQDRFRNRFGVESWSLLIFLTPSGEQIAVDCFRVSGIESLEKMRDEYVERIGAEAIVSQVGESTIVSGPRKTINGENGEESEGWLPMILRYQNGWLFQSDSKYVLKLKFGRQLLDRLSDLDGADWYFASSPTSVPEIYRSAMLGQVFARMGVQRQRRDNESLASYAKRIAPT